MNLPRSARHRLGGFAPRLAGSRRPTPPLDHYTEVKSVYHATGS